MEIGIQVVINEYRDSTRSKSVPPRKLVSYFDKERAASFKRFVEQKDKHGMQIAIYSGARIIVMSVCCPHVAGFSDGNNVSFSMDEFPDPFMWDKPDADDILTMIFKELENVK